MYNSSPACTTSLPVTMKQLGWTEESAQAFSTYTGPYVPGRVACR
jgi:ribosome biogenesis GTPase